MIIIDASILHIWELLSSPPQAVSGGPELAGSSVLSGDLTAITSAEKILLY